MTKLSKILIKLIIPIDLSNYRPVYAPKDLLEVLLSLKGPLRQEDELVLISCKLKPQFLGNEVTLDLLFSVYPKWEFSHITLPVKSLHDLKMHFRDLLIGSVPKSDWSIQCRKILARKHSPLCQYALKKGHIPKPLRGELWSYVLGSHNFVNVNILNIFQL